MCVEEAVESVARRVADLEDAVLEARAVLASPPVRLDTDDIITLAQRVAYTTSAPRGWQVRFRRSCVHVPCSPFPPSPPPQPGLLMKPFLFCAPAEEEIRLSLLFQAQEHRQRFANKK